MTAIFSLIRKSKPRFEAVLVAFWLFVVAEKCVAEKEFSSTNSSDRPIGRLTEGPSAEWASPEASSSFSEKGAASSPIAKRPQPTGSALLPLPAVFESPEQDPLLQDQEVRVAISVERNLSNPMSPAERELAEEVFRLTNLERASAGLPVLNWDEKLSVSATSHAADMESDGYFDHDSYDRQNGQLVRVCSAFERLQSFATYGAGENIAQGQQSAAEVVATWMASPPHRKGILRPDIDKLGVGVAGRTWVQNFGW